MFDPNSALPLPTITVDQAEASRLTKLSAKTLGRFADAGEPLGRLKVGRRVLYLRAALESWLVSKAEVGVPQ